MLLVTWDTCTHSSRVHHDGLAKVHIMATDDRPMQMKLMMMTMATTKAFDIIYMLRFAAIRCTQQNTNP